jgi:hypothetical protein
MLDHPVEEGVHWFMGKVWPLKEGQVRGLFRPAGCFRSCVYSFLLPPLLRSFSHLHLVAVPGFQAKSNRCGQISLAVHIGVSALC